MAWYEGTSQESGQMAWYEGTSQESAFETFGPTDLYLKSLSTKLYNNEELSDVILKVGGKRYHVHKFLLCHFSDVLKTMLLSSHWPVATKHVVELTETPEAVEVFDSFLKFMYGGQITLNVNIALSVLALADKYNVKILRSLCNDYMTREIVKAGNVGGALQWWGKTKTYNAVDLGPECLDLIAQSLDEAMSTPEWLQLSPEQMFAILAHREIIVDSEFSLFKGVESWLQSREDIGSCLDILLPLIHFSCMTPDEVSIVEKSQLYTEYKTKFVPYLYEAFRYHALKGNNQSQDLHDVVPRMYIKLPQRHHLRCYSELNLQWGSIPVWSTSKTLYSSDTSFAVLHGGHQLQGSFQREEKWEKQQWQMRYGQVGSHSVQSRQSRFYSDYDTPNKIPTNLVVVLCPPESTAPMTYSLRIDLYQSVNQTVSGESTENMPILYTIRGQGHISEDGKPTLHINHQSKPSDTSKREGSVKTVNAEMAPRDLVKRKLWELIEEDAKIQKPRDHSRYTYVPIKVVCLFSDLNLPQCFTVRSCIFAKLWSDKQ